MEANVNRRDEQRPPTVEESARSNSVLVIGAGIAGIQASLDLANAGIPVYLVEKLSSIGGKMAQLDKTFPTLDCSSCILTPKMADVPRNPNITLLTTTEVVGIEGSEGAFHVTLERQPRYVDVDACTGCGLCAEVCPVVVPNTFNADLDWRKAIYRRFPQAVPTAFVIEKHPSPCKSTCPAHIPVQGYIALIAEGKFREALELIRNSGVPFVGTLGRVCFHPCEEICKRSEWDEPVAICALKRFAYDASLMDACFSSPALTNSDQEDLPDESKMLSTPILNQWSEKVAIVGAGPAGLTAAYELARRGYRVTVFDAMPVAGGMLAAGIPAYRLPRQILKQEIDYICSLGVELRLNTPIGKDGGPGLDDLRKEYQSIFLAVGAQGSSRLGIPGEEAKGVYQALTFLRDLNLKGTAQVGKQIAVIGGGDSAIDAARCALRLQIMQSEKETSQSGISQHEIPQVMLLYRRSRQEMPAAAEEVEAAEAEGVRLNFLVAPVRIIEDAGRVCGIECVRMELGEPDASGRRRPVPIPGSNFNIALDMVIAAIGQTVEADGLKVALNRDRVTVDPLTLETSIPGVFAGGDAVIGPASVVEAIGMGIQAAESIHRYLRGLDLRQVRSVKWLPPEEIMVRPAKPVSRTKREPVPELDVSARLRPIHQGMNNDLAEESFRYDYFQEIKLGFSAEQAIREAKRCLACATCSECLQCVSVCQRGAINHADQVKRMEVDVGAIIIATGFDVFDARRKPEFGYGAYPEVITSLEFERLVSASGPTAGKIVLDGHFSGSHGAARGKIPKKIVFIQCVGSRDRSLDLPNCSRVCCMAVAKQAHLAHERLPEAEITVFYMDVRAFGKGFEEFYDRVRKEGILYRRGNPAEIIRKNGHLVVRAEDTLLGELIEVEADLVVLAIGMKPPASAQSLANLLNIKLDKNGFFLEAHPKLQTVKSTTAGIFLAGCCQGPKDIPDTVAQAKAAAAAALVSLAAGAARKGMAEGVLPAEGILPPVERGGVHDQN